MRLDKEQAEFITGTIRDMDPEARVYLFGSRVSDDAKGGDIDLLVLSSSLKYRDKLLIRSRLREGLGNRKIDLIITESPQTSFEKSALTNSIQISS